MKLQERIELLKYHTPSKNIFNGTIVDEWTTKDGVSKNKFDDVIIT